MVTAVEIPTQYKSLYKDLIGLGKSREEAKEIIERLQRQEEDYQESPEEDEGREITKRGISLRIQYSKSDILVLIPNWDSLPLETKEEYLWSLGINTKKGHFYEEDRIHTTIKGKKIFGTVIYGQERLDKEWIRKLDKNGRSVASDEAK